MLEEKKTNGKCEEKYFFFQYFDKKKLFILRFREDKKLCGMI